MSGGPSTAGEIIQIQTKNKKVKPNRYLLKNLGKCQGRNFCHWIEKILIWHFNSIIDSHCDFGPSNPFIEFLLDNRLQRRCRTSFFVGPLLWRRKNLTKRKLPENNKSQRKRLGKHHWKRVDTYWPKYGILKRNSTRQCSVEY